MIHKQKAMYRYNRITVKEVRNNREARSEKCIKQNTY